MFDFFLFSAGIYLLAFPFLAVLFAIYATYTYFKN